MSSAGRPIDEEVRRQTSLRSRPARSRMSFSCAEWFLLRFASRRSFPGIDDGAHPVGGAVSEASARTTRGSVRPSRSLAACGTSYQAECPHQLSCWRLPNGSSPTLSLWHPSTSQFEMVARAPPPICLHKEKQCQPSARQRSAANDLPEVLSTRS